MLAAQLYIMNFWKLLCEDDSYMEEGGGIRIIVEMLLFAWTLKFESPCQNLTVMINLNVFLANGWNLKLILFFVMLFLLFIYSSSTWLSPTNHIYGIKKNVTHHSRKSGIEMGGKMGFSFLPSYLSPLAILPPLIQTIMDMCFALTFRQTDRHIFISQGTLWRIF